MGENLESAFTITLDGSIQTATKITAPTNDYLKYSPHALLRGEMYIFGGIHDGRKVKRMK